MKTGQNWRKLGKTGENWAKLGKTGQNWGKLGKINLGSFYYTINSGEISSKQAPPRSRVAYAPRPGRRGLQRLAPFEAAAASPSELVNFSAN